MQANILCHAAVSSGHVVCVGHIVKLAKYHLRCHEVNVEFTLLAWKTSGCATNIVHSSVKRLTRFHVDRTARDVRSLRLGLYRRLPLIIPSHNGKMMFLERLPRDVVVAARTSAHLC